MHAHALLAASTSSSVSQEDRGTRQPRNQPLTGAERQRIVDLYLEHSGGQWRYSVTDIADLTGRSIQTISNIVSAAGATRPANWSVAHGRTHQAIYRWVGSKYARVTHGEPGELDIVVRVEPNGRVEATVTPLDCPESSCRFGCTAICARRQLGTRPATRRRRTGDDEAQQPATDGETDQRRPLPTLPERRGPWNAEWFTQQLKVVAARVRAIRMSLGFGQERLDALIRKGRGSTARIETGDQAVQLDTLWRIADGLHVHWADLLNDRDATPPDATYSPPPFQQQLAAFGDRAHQARRLQRLSQDTVGHRTGIGRTRIAEIEGGTVNINLRSLARLAAGLGVHWADLLDDRDPNPPLPTLANPAPVTEVPVVTRRGKR